MTFYVLKNKLIIKKDMKEKGEIMKFDYLKLAEIIKIRRIEKDISTRKLAEKIGISHAEISRFENGLKPSFYFIPFVKMCKELDLDLTDLLEEIGLLEEKSERKYEVKITNVDENYFEIMAKNEKEAATIVAKFVIENEIIELDSNKRIDIEVEEIDEEFNEDEEEIEEEFTPDDFCKGCKFYCPYCGECTLGE